LQMKDKNGIFNPIGGLIGRANFHNNYIKNTNLFSMSGFSLENLSEGNNQFLLDSRFLTFGDKAVIIYDVPKFFSKIKKGFESKKKIIQIPNEPFYFRHIEYVSNNYNGRLGVFRKLDSYKWQQELRIAIYRNVKSLSPKPYVFRIGSLKKISMVFDTEHLITEGLLINLQKSSVKITS
ncbi:TPA: hypothetical protein JD746_001771, partial [Legionella pneumophila]|nr:hypothetical protein [Legionella pneumophila]